MKIGEKLCNFIVLYHSPSQYQDDFEIFLKNSELNLDTILGNNPFVVLFNKTIKNIIRNYIPHETITCDDRDPPWIIKDIKELIHGKNQAYKSYRQNRNNMFSVHQFELVQSKLVL